MRFNTHLIFLSKESNVLSSSASERVVCENDVAAKQRIGIIDSLIADRAHGGIAVAVNGEGVLKAINREIKSGIRVVAYDSDASDSKRLAHIGNDNVAFSDMLGKIMHQVKPE